jgi:hypothetical protein
VLTLHDVCHALGKLQENADYRACAEPPMTDDVFLAFWQEVNITRTRCLTPPPNSPTVTEIHDRLIRLHRMTVGTLVRFRPQIDHAQAVLAAI